MLYRSHLKIWLWATRKLLGFDDCNYPYIANIRTVTIVESKRFGAAENQKFTWFRY